MNSELITKLQNEQKMLEQQMLDVFSRNGSVMPLLAYWKQLNDVLKEVAPKP